MYKLIKGFQNSIGLIKNKEDGSLMAIPMDEANTDYANFKKEVFAGAELQEADGNVMTDASAFIATLP